jgi:hypothetical protein
MATRTRLLRYRTFGLTARIRQHRWRRKVSTGPPSSPGEDLGSVTFEVQRPSIGPWESCPEQLDVSAWTNRP